MNSFKNKKYIKNRNMICTNCRKKGHEYKDCIEPTTSLGIILLKLD